MCGAVRPLLVENVACNWHVPIHLLNSGATQPLSVAVFEERKGPGVTALG